MKKAISRLVLVTGTVMVAACSEDAAPPQFPPPEVAVVAAHAQTIPLTREVVGRLAPTRVAEVRARVSGIILERVYTEGTDVEPGQTLFRIDPAPVQAELNAAEAALTKARVDAGNAARIARRTQALAPKGLVSSQDLDNALANERSAAAAVGVAQANVATARLRLGYATVSSPIAGRAGKALVTEGALVGEGESTRLTTVEQIDPIFVNFSQSASELREFRSSGQVGGTVQVLQADGKQLAAGTVDFSGLAVEPSTGVVSLRAIVPNPDRQLLPGMFVNLRITLGQLSGVFVLPQASVLRDPAGAYALVVEADNKVAQRRVETHGMTSSDWIVSGELREGDQVIVSGVQKARPGQPARAVSASTEKAPPPEGSRPGS
ncbi:MAG: efflux RND transporter periplasmic adaptor subunit [Gammaproteobacteria bacterium]|nr:efflux RND transporter periplasmic adaptor subunit [Gammaproteobacteria bacterium]